MQNKYLFTKLILIMWKNNEEIRRFVDISKAEGMEVELINEPQPEELEALNMTSSLIITDMQTAADWAVSHSYPVVAYSHSEAPEISGIKYTIEELCEVEESYFNMVYQRAHNQPVIISETKRTLIREMTTADLPELYRLYAHENVKPYVEPLYEYEEELEFTKAYIENMYTFYGYGLWLVFDKENGELIGRAGISNRIIDGDQKQELGYIISGYRQKQGLGYEVSQAIIDYAYTALGLSELFLCTKKDNNPSIALAKKIGFTPYGETDEYFIFKIELTKKIYDAGMYSV